MLLKLYKDVRKAADRPGDGADGVRHYQCAADRNRPGDYRLIYGKHDSPQIDHHIHQHIVQIFIECHPESMLPNDSLEPLHDITKMSYQDTGNPCGAHLLCVLLRIEYAPYISLLPLICLSLHTAGESRLSLGFSDEEAHEQRNQRDGQEGRVNRKDHEGCGENGEQIVDEGIHRGQEGVRAPFNLIHRPDISIIELWGIIAEQVDLLHFPGDELPHILGYPQVRLGHIAAFVPVPSRQKNNLRQADEPDLPADVPKSIPILPTVKHYQENIHIKNKIEYSLDDGHQNIQEYPGLARTKKYAASKIYCW